MATYRLGSSEFAYAPGLIAWAINGYAFEKDRPQLRRVIAESWGIPGDIVHKLLSKEISYKIEDEKVVFSVEDKAGR